MDKHLIPELIIQELLLPNAVQIVERQARGLSGAKVWRAQGFIGQVALRCWPAEHPTPERLNQIHAAMKLARQGGISSVPSIICNAAGKSYTTDGKQLWELTEWMPGLADYMLSPSEPRLCGGLRELARLHCVWEHALRGPEQISPTVVERHVKLQHWLQRIPELTVRATALSAELLHLAGATLRQLAVRGPELLTDLEQLRREPVRVHFVLRDIWSDHVLFTGEEVSGIIDFGAARIDEPATDVARLLSSLEPDDGQRWHVGWESYHAVNPQVDLRRVRVLDQVGTLLSALQWLQWLVIESRRFHAPEEELRTRWRNFVRRLENS